MYIPTYPPRGRARAPAGKSRPDLHAVAGYMWSLEFRLGEVAGRRTRDAGSWVALEQLLAACTASQRGGWRRRRRARRVAFWVTQVAQKGWPLALRPRQWST